MDQMPPERRSEIEALFEAALQRPRAGRRAWLEQACEGDAALCGPVLRLLEASERAAGILDRSARGIAAGWIVETESNREPMEGASLGPYEVVREIGRGGMGVVYEGRHRRLDRPAALKLLAPHLATEGDARARFIHEACTASALDHPNICTIYDIGESNDGRVFLAMAYYDGETLRTSLDRGRLTIDAAAGYAAQVAHALLAAHEAGVVHRDLKPANLMITRDGRIKLLDFGLAKLAGGAGVTRPGTHLGTAAYMSPEQARGESADDRSDLWALGVVLYEMLTGVRPFRGETEPAILRAILDDSPVPLASRREDVPPGLAGVVERALEKDPALRYQSAAELLRDLESPHSRQPTPALRAPSVVGGPLDAGPSPATRDERVRAIAVLPFADLSPDAKQGYLCEGMAEELLHALAHVDGLRVASRLRQVELPSDVGVIGRALNVDTVIEGSIRKAGASIRVTVRLVRLPDASLLWSNQYDRELKDVFAIQEDIAQSVMRALRLTLGGAPLASLRAARTTRIEAYELCLMGRQHFLRDTRRDLEIARNMFAGAIEIDPGYARAHAGLSDACAFLYKHFDQNAALLQEADDASRAAIDLDAASADARTSRAVVYWLQDRLAQADAAFAEAIRLDPDSFDAHYLYGMCCYSTGRPERAVEMFTRAWAQRTDDFQSPVLIGALHRAMGNEHEAHASFQRGRELAERHLELNPDNVRARCHAAFACVGTGRPAAGLEWARSALDMAPGDAMVLYNVAAVHALAGHRDEGLDYLERAVDSGFAYRPDLQFDPDFSTVRSDPRFQSLLDRLIRHE